jgi:quinol monooxygenase YgiN
MRTLLIALTFVHAMAVPCLAETFQERIGLCLTCHGENGQSDNVEVPSLGAEPAPFVLIQLYLFREKQRRVEPMTDAAKDLKFEIMVPHDQADTVMLYEIYASPEAFETHWHGPAKQEADRDFEPLRVSVSFVRCDRVE